MMAKSKKLAALLGVGVVLLLALATAVVRYYMVRGRSEASATRESAATVPAVYHGPAIVGYARTPDGKPVSGAQVLVSTPDHFLTMAEGGTGRPSLVLGTIRVSRSGVTDVQYGKTSGSLQFDALPQATTDLAGRFEFQPTSQPAGIIVRGTQGIGVTTAAEMMSSHVVVVRPWARIEGDVRVGREPIAKANIYCINVDDVDLLGRANADIQAFGTSDENGHFVIPQAMPGMTFIRPTFSYHGVVFLGHDGQIELGGFPQKRLWFSKVIDMREGTTTKVPMGGTGRPIIGRASARLDGFDYRRGSLSADPPLYADNIHLFDLASDGGFQVPDMPAGKYHLHAEFAKPFGLLHPITYRYLDFIAEADADFVIQPMPDGGSDDPLDIGELQIKSNPHLSVGQPVPDLTAKSLGGSVIRLSGLRGKVVLLQVWTASRRYLLREQDQLKPIFDRFVDEPRFKMLGLNIGPNPREACEAAIQTGVRWPQAFLADPSKDLPQQYRNSGSSLYLIDPQRKLVAENVDGFDMWGSIEKILAVAP